MSYSKRPNHRHITTNKSSNTACFKNVNQAHVDNLLSMITKAYTTSILHQLEDHRNKLSRSAFRVLLLTLTTELNSETWKECLDEHDKKLSRRRISNQNFPWAISLCSRIDIDHCCKVVLYYIVSVINKYEITSAENIWIEILKNSLTHHKQFYEYLYKNKIIIPNKICELFSTKFSPFYSTQSYIDKIKLLRLGFRFDRMITSDMRIKDLERLFTELKQQQYNDKIIKPENFISLMNTPEKLSLVLCHFPDYDINRVKKKTNFNVLEQLINMKPYFYLPRSKTHNHFRWNVSLSRGILDGTLSALETSKIDSHPNEIVKYRAVRIINLLQQLIGRGARFSKPVYSGISIRIINEHRFLTTSLGIYVLISLRMNDLYPSESPFQRDKNFVSFILKYIKIFQPEFQDFILHCLASSYSIIHKPEFMIQQRENENEQIQRINDKLFQRSLKLKEWCRLKIKDICSVKDINKLNLPESLVNYCSFSLLDSNYASQCIREAIQHKGNISPNRMQYRDETNRWILIENSDDEHMINDDNSSDDEYMINDDNSSDDESDNSTMLVYDSNDNNENQ